MQDPMYPSFETYGMQKYWRILTVNPIELSVGTLSNKSIGSMSDAMAEPLTITYYTFILEIYLIHLT